ncbi:hypothetical protein QWY99_12475 [Flavobacterium branchiarum]|uniref:YD repeat-containing protein n=1 Tax=Flavobacterium branchiarum TaxID=1114870 RepID=A0ABV5FHG2_9FLAO|nr:hypothetical protein [Flavobacterium branchiarum]MDN3673866.1 hypothetical protein [Flavobacterium branchiarum]
MKKILFLFSTILLTLASCSSDDNEKETPLILVKKRIISDLNGLVITGNITYNGNKIVSNKDEDGDVRYTYTGDYITKIEVFLNDGSLAVTNEYTYANGKQTSAVIKVPNTTTYSKTLYTHNTNETITYESFRINATTGAKTEESTGKYTSKNGNLVISESSRNGVKTIRIYEYDNQNNPYKNVLGFNLLVDSNTASNNNIVKETSISESSGSVPVTTATFSYKYNENNYPTEKVYTIRNEAPSPTFLYFY